jgi:predicted lipid-binding transport protein (Tim44 family)
MATIALGTVGGILGGAIGGPIGAIAGRAVGALAGSFVDQQIVAALTPPVRREGPRLTTSARGRSPASGGSGRTARRSSLKPIRSGATWATRSSSPIR